MRLASIQGLASLSIGGLARELGISKSGVFAHFQSIERLRHETIAAAEEVFRHEVLDPGLAAPHGLPRLRRLCEAYLSYVERGVFPGGCFFAQLLADFDGQSGPIHEQLEAGQRGWLALLEGQIDIARERGELDPATDPCQLAFELYAPLELANYLFVLNRDPSFIQRGHAAVEAALARAAPQLHTRPDGRDTAPRH